MIAPAVTPNWTHPATVVRVIDGDTLIVRLDLGRYPHRIQTEVPIRIAGLYAPELKDPAGREAMSYLGRLMHDLDKGGAIVSRPLIVQTRKPDPRDLYGRVVADVWLEDGTSIAEAMIQAGHGTGPP